MNRITPTVIPAPSFPRWVFWLCVVGLNVSLIGSLLPHGLNATLQQGVSAVGFSMGAGFGSWAERRFHHRFLGRSIGVRAVASGLLVPGGLLIGFPLALIFGTPSAWAGDQGFIRTASVVAVFWMSSASMGSLVVAALDGVVSQLISSFRERVMAAVLVLIALAGVGAAITVSGADYLVRSILSGRLDNVTVDLGAGVIQDEELMTLLASDSGYFTVLAVFVSLTAFFALPAVISAAGKLADAVMERVHPLTAGFRAVAEGTFDVSIEEGGATEFVQLARDFNGMTEQLALAQTMERSFGQYLSTALLDRIREQHGVARLPATKRNATVFFADIRGFTSMSEAKEPEQVLDILNRYFARIIPVINEHEGYLDKFIGDEVFVVFNGPIDQPDHAERAATCALAIQAEVARMNQEGLFSEINGMKVGIGLATGPLVAGNLGSDEQMEYTVIGDTVNVAARLTSQASAGEIIVNATNAGAHGLPSVALPDIVVKGKAEPMTPFRLGGQESAPD